MILYKIIKICMEICLLRKHILDDSSKSQKRCRI